MKIRITDQGTDQYLVALQVEAYGPVDLFRVEKSKAPQEPMGLVHYSAGVYHDRGFDVERRVPGSDRRVGRDRRAGFSYNADCESTGGRRQISGGRRKGAGSDRRA